MRNSSNHKKGVPALYLQATIVLLVAAAVVAFLLLAHPSDDLPPILPAPTPIPAAASGLIFDLNGGSLSSIARFGLLDEQGVTSTFSVVLPIGATYDFQRGRIVTFATSDRAATQFFTATYSVGSLGALNPQQVSDSVTGTNQIGDVYTFSPPLLAPDASSIAYIRSHQQFIDNGLKVQLTWALLRVDLNTQAISTLGSGQLQGASIPGVLPVFWSSATNQIYLNMQTDNSQPFARNASLYPYDAGGHGPGKQINIPSPFNITSPDGSEIAYLTSTLATFDPQQLPSGNQIVVQDLSSGSSQTISAVPGDIIEPSFAWSPDSHSLAYVEQIAPPTPVAGKQSAGSLFYHIQLKRFDLGNNQSLTLSEYRANPNLSTTATNSQVFWCGVRLYLQVFSFLGGGQTSGSLYAIAPDGSSGLRPAYPGAWTHPILDCAP